MAYVQEKYITFNYTSIIPIRLGQHPLKAMDKKKSFVFFSY